ncbi:SDR family oxidoreductase [Actinomadura vinacea]|uniref:SDR family oxidoreductase n=1 Tax=Actinomadura vinacea TaxID=115336 RepID=A0ABP5VQT5_9ACTN
MGFLDGRTALVTGGGQGVGRGIALALAAEGAAVALAGRTEGKLDGVAEEIKDRGGRAMTVVCDVKDADALAACVDEAASRLGGIGILVNNAQQSLLGTVLGVTEEDLDAAWRSGPLAAFRLMRLCHPYLQAANGVVINLGSSAAVNPAPTDRGVYGALKAAMAGLTRAAGTEWGPDGIRVITVMPAATSAGSEAYARNSPELYARSLESIPLRRLGDAEQDIGRFVALLCGPDGAYLTATTIALDGGQAYLR